MNPAHLHLLLNHLPTVGFGMAFVLFIASFFGKNEPLRRASLVLLFLVAVMAVPAYMTGVGAERLLCPEGQCPAEVSKATIRKHEDAALVALTLMTATGFFAWLALWQLRWKPRLASWNWVVVLVLGVATFGLMATAATEGGEIRHPEIEEGEEVVAAAGLQASEAAESQAAPEAEKPEGGETPSAESPEAAQTSGEDTGEAPGEGDGDGDADAADEESAGLALSIGDTVAGNTGISWLWPASEAIHFIGLCLLFSVVIAVNLRILGMAKGLSFQALYQLLPFGMLGFLLNLVTGMLFFLAAPGQYVSNDIFHKKVIMIVLGGINVLYFMLFEDVWAVGPEDNAPARVKFASIASIVIWIGVLYYGHMLPFLGNAF